MPIAAESDQRLDAPLHEIVCGEHVELPSRGAQAVRIASLLCVRLENYGAAKRAGIALTEAMFIINPEHNTRRRPDVAFVSAARWPLDRSPPTGDWPLAPDLAVEVISPNDLMESLDDKLPEYFAAGVREVWVVRPKRRLVYVHTSEDDYRVVREGSMLTTPVLPEFSLPVAELFPWPA